MRSGLTLQGGCSKQLVVRQFGVLLVAEAADGSAG